MPDISGTDFLESIQDPPMVIFTTAYSEHAVSGFELDAIDYLLKPFSLPPFPKACNKAQELYHLKYQTVHPEDSGYVFLKDGYEQIKVFFDDILFIEAAGNYCKVVLQQGKMVCPRMSVAEMLLLLPRDRFIRTHRAFIIAVKRISRFDRSQVFIGEQAIPIGATYAEDFVRFIG